MPKRKLSFRLPDATIQQLDHLRQSYGNMTTALVVAIDRMCRSEESHMTSSKYVYTGTLYDQARERVLDSELLRPYRSFILDDWPEGDDHWNWVLSASEQEILDWCGAGEAEPEQ